MQLSTIALFLATAFASTETVKLTSKSEVAEVNNIPITSLHEGAGINVMFLTEPGEPLEYDTETGVLGFPIGSGYWQTFNVLGNIPLISVTGSKPVYFDEDGFLSYNNSTLNFYACKNISFDTYHYSEKYYAVTYYKDSAPEACHAIKIQKSEA